MTRIHAAWSLSLILAVAPRAFGAEGWELSLLAGWTAPTFEERAVFDTDIELPVVPGASFEQQGEFALTGRGSFAFGGALAYFFNDALGLEGRIDTVDFAVDTEGPRITGTASLPPPLPPLGATLDLSNGSVNVERLLPLSLNLKARTGGAVRFVASGGVSFLPRLRFTAVQEATLGVGGALGTFPVATVAVEADGGTEVPASERIGFNGGAGVEVRLGERLSFVAEGRVFRFPKQTFGWRAATVAGGRVEEQLLELLENELGPLELDLAYFHVSGGLVVRF
jgi:hypothetical protein